MSSANPHQERFHSFKRTSKQSLTLTRFEGQAQWKQLGSAVITNLICSILRLKSVRKNEGIKNFPTI